MSAAFEDSFRDPSEHVVTEVEVSERTEVSELIGRELRIESVSQQVVAEANVRQGVLNTFEDTFGNSSERVPGEVHRVEGDVSGGEEHGTKSLQSGVSLTELLDVESPGQDGKVKKHSGVAVDPNLRSGRVTL